MASTAMESIRLWLALTPKQFEDLNNGKEIQPDEYSKRFGLRKDPVAAVERAQYFNDWTPEGPKGEFCAKDYVLVEVEPPLAISRKPRRGSSGNISPTNTVGRGR